jgi:TolB-like protein/tetratricopeptide (TPR) repeat protein
VEPAFPRAAFTLGDWLVEPALDRISKDGAVRHLRPRLMDLLVFLAQHPGEVVTKDQILDHVWQQRFVAESVLSRSVADLRQLLDDDAEQPRYIETIPKRGYRLVAAEGSLVPRAADAARRPSVVVLPFVDMASGHDQEYFCDGLAEELTNGLAQLAGLRVVARTSAFAFKGRAVDVRQVGRALNVGAVLEGGVQRAGDRLRVTVQLIDVADSCHLWSQRFDRPAGDIFAIEDEIVRSVVLALKVKLLGDRAGRAMVRTTANPAAHDLYLKGRHLAARRSPESMAQALQCFERAVEADPSYAAAHAAIGECQAVAGFAGFSRPSDVFPLARQAAIRARELDPDLADAHAVLGHESGMFEWRWDEAEAHFQRALELSPGYALARVWYSHLLTASGRFDEAIEETERACECDPLSPTVRATLGLALYYARRFERAEETYKAVLDADPSFALAHFFLGRLYMVQGRLEEAVEQQAAASVIPTALGVLAGAWRRLGRPDRARDLVRGLERLAKARYVGPLAWFVANADDPDAQLAWLERAVDAREGSVPLLNTDAGMDPLRGDPRYHAIIGRLGLPVVPVPSPR